MPNDARVGLFLGVVVVVAIAVVYFRKEGPAALPLAGEATAAVNAPKAPPPPSQRLTRPVKARPTRQQDGTADPGSEAAPRDEVKPPKPELIPASSASADEDPGP